MVPDGFNLQAGARANLFEFMKGVILAAGKGTRLYPVTKAIAKPLLPIANRMTIEYAFDQLKGCRITEIGLVVGENEPEMRAALGDGSQFGVSLAYINQPEAKGLANAVGYAREFVGGDDFMLYLGDAIYGESLLRYVEQFKTSGAANLNLVKAVEDPRRFGVANVQDGRIVKLVEKPAVPESNLAMAGMYIFGPQLWSVLPDLQPSARGEYEITDAIQVMIDQGELVVPGIYEGTWFDTGTLPSFLETSQFLTGGDPLIASTAQLKVNTVAGMVIVGEGATVEASHMEDCVILPGAKVRADRIRGSLIGGHVDADGSIIDEIRWG
jgi:glucose-1-phosphate thymidylyltransferase